MRIRGLGRVRVVGKKIRNRLSPGVLILVYHRIANLTSDPQRLCVSPENFSGQLEVIEKVSRPISLKTLREHLRVGEVPKKAVVITFDDGAADNLYSAKPILEKHDIAATVFVSTGYMKTGREYWWDELQRIFLEPVYLPTELRLTIAKKTCQWNLAGAEHYSQGDYHKYKNWEAVDPEAPTKRHQLYRDLIELLLPLSFDERLQILDQLKNWAGDQILARSGHRPMTCEEVRKISDNGIEVGAHTVSHSMLAALPVSVQQSEIRESKKDLEEVLDRRVSSFAYPFGTLSDYSVESVKISKDVGFDCACSNFSGVVQPSTDIFQLPRLVVRDWPGDEFAARLWEWFRG